MRIRLQQLDDLPVPRTLKKAGLPLLSLSGLQQDFHYEYVRRGSLGQPIFWSGTETYPHTLKQRLLSQRLRKSFNGYTSWEALAPTRKRFVDNVWDQGPLNWMTYADLNLSLPELLLMRVDKMGMGASVEGRVPFLDHKFVEFAMSIPSEMKTRNDELKYILKKAVRGVIPDEIIDRKKQWFGVPVSEWLDNELGVHMAREPKKFCDDSDLLDWPEVERTQKWPQKFRQPDKCNLRPRGRRHRPIERRGRWREGREEITGRSSKQR